MRGDGVSEADLSRGQAVAPLGGQGADPGAQREPNASSAFREFAPAKVNLTLAITGRRDDGRHALDSLTVFADVGDQLTLAASEGEALAGRGAPIAPQGAIASADRMDGPFAGALSEALASGVPSSVSAARELLAARCPGAAAMLRAGRFHLHKALPVAAGLGGGTADAAAALRLLARVAGLGLDRATLAEWGAALGSDVPACVWSQPLRMTGAGERITRLAHWPTLHGVLVNPGLACPTGPVFAAYREAGSGFSAPAAPPACTRVDDALRYVVSGANDLTAAAIAVQPVVAAVLQAVRARPGVQLARMSGSGASVFAITADAAAAARLAADLAHAQPRWWVRACRFLGTDAEKGQTACANQ